MENDKSGFKDFVVRMISAFEESGIKYAIIGAVAGLCYGLGRTTRDVDTLALVKREQKAATIHQKLGEHHFSFPPKSAFIDDLLHQTPLRCEDTKTEFHIDLFGVIDEIERKIIENRKRKHIYSHKVWISPLEPLIILKLRAGRPQDISDVTELILSNQQSLQWKHLRALAERNNVQEDLDILVEELPTRRKK